MCPQLRPVLKPPLPRLKHALPSLLLSHVFDRVYLPRFGLKAPSWGLLPHQPHIISLLHRDVWARPAQKQSHVVFTSAQSCKQQNNPAVSTTTHCPAPKPDQPNSRFSLEMSKCVSALLSEANTGLSVVFQKLCSFPKAKQMSGFVSVLRGGSRYNNLQEFGSFYSRWFCRSEIRET